MNNPVQLLQCRVLHNDNTLRDFGVCTLEEVLDHYDDTHWHQELLTMETLRSAGKKTIAPRMRLKNSHNGSMTVLPQSDDTLTVRYNCIETRKILGLIPVSKIHKLSFSRLHSSHLERILRVFAQGEHQNTLALLNQLNSVPRQVLR